MGTASEIKLISRSDVDFIGFLILLVFCGPGGDRESHIGLPLYVKLQCLPITASEHDRSLRDRTNWYLETVRNHSCRPTERLDSARDR